MSNNTDLSEPMKITGPIWIKGLAIIMILMFTFFIVFAYMGEGRFVLSHLWIYALFLLFISIGIKLLFDSFTTVSLNNGSIAKKAPCCRTVIVKISDIKKITVKKETLAYSIIGMNGETLHFSPYLKNQWLLINAILKDRPELFNADLNPL